MLKEYYIVKAYEDGELLEEVKATEITKNNNNEVVVLDIYGEYNIYEPFTELEIYKVTTERINL